MIELNRFQTKLLANFFSDVAKGALLSALGFPIITDLPWNLKALAIINGSIGTLFFLYLALEVSKGVKE